MENPCLVIFMKNPVKGKVKTRLAKDIGDDHAIMVYEELLHIMFTIVQTVPLPVYVFYSDCIDESDFWRLPNVSKRLQHGENLGIRMKNAFSETLEQHSSVILMGSDCPYIDKELLEDAFEKLRYSDIVIGPATDGGYYLLGMKKIHESLFTNMPWSSESVFNITKNRIEDLSLNYAALKPLSDIDTEADWKNYKSFVKRKSRT